MHRVFHTLPYHTIKLQKSKLLFHLFSYRMIRESKECQKIICAGKSGTLKGVILNFMDGIIFDVDGTLWDSTEIVARAWDHYLREDCHMDISISAKRLKSLFGQLLPDIAKQLFPDHSQEEQLRLIDACCQAEHAALLREAAPLYPGLEKTLQVLSQKVPLFIVSNCQAGYIEVFLKSTGFSHYFTDHLCPGDTGLAKAENISAIVKKHHLKEPVYVGDTLGDFQACKKSGVPFVLASYGFGDAPDPDFRITKPEDLITLFD